MRKILCGLVFAAFGATAHAGGSATVTCGGNYTPVLTINYMPGADTGTPGLFWLGVLSPDQTVGAVMTERGWEGYQGGLYPFQARYDKGLPGSISMTIPIPTGSSTTADWVGYGVYLGSGAYTAEAKKKVQDRRTVLNSVRAKRVAAGKWSAEYDSDDRFIWSLVQKDMIDGNKFGSVLSIPYINCTPYDGGSS